ncbi:MAG: phosphate ABC transporter substrate-binding protein PstS [Frankiaceae bacterium]|nr:phosphate ABC transporter substrate-binding protein PstS [Frankiaceae bacterium]
MKLQRTTRLVALLAAGSLALTACSDDDQAGSTDTVGTPSEGAASELSGTLAGAGASSQGAAMEGWIAGFQSANEGVTINYDPVGSSGGREQFLNGGTDFGGTDSSLDDEELALADERCGDGGLIEVPLYISPIAVAFNLPGIETLNLGPAVIAGIFKQEITQWNAPEIAADNPDAELPDLAITPVNRSDGSGTTKNFTQYLAAVAPDVWTFEAEDEWPVPGGEAGQGTSGVIQAVTAAEGAIGYADASQVGDLGTVAVGVGEEFVEYSPEAAAAVVDSSPRVEGRPEGSLALELARDTAESGNYPVVLVSYSLACKTYEDKTQGELVKAFLEYVASEDGQAAAQESAGSAPISEAVRTDVLAQLEQIGA